MDVDPNALLFFNVYSPKNFTKCQIHLRGKAIMAHHRCLVCIIVHKSTPRPLRKFDCPSLLMQAFARHWKIHLIAIVHIQGLMQCLGFCSFPLFYSCQNPQHLKLCHDVVAQHAGWFVLVWVYFVLLRKLTALAKIVF